MADSRNAGQGWTRQKTWGTLTLLGVGVVATYIMPLFFLVSALGSSDREVAERWEEVASGLLILAPVSLRRVCSLCPANSRQSLGAPPEDG